MAYGVILISISYRYLPIFPQEAELNPIDEPDAADAVAEVVTEEAADAEDAESEDAGEGDLQPAEG